MVLSRRALGKNCLALLAASAFPRAMWGVPGPFFSPQRDKSSGLPHFTADNFSKVSTSASVERGSSNDRTWSRSSVRIWILPLAN